MMNTGIAQAKGRFVIAVVAAGAVVSACGGGQVDETPAEPVGADATPTDLAPAEYAPDPTGRVVLPLDAYQDRLTTATGGLAADAVDCFVGVGVDPADVGVEVNKAEQHDRRYGVVDESIAARYGYHPPLVKDPRDALLDAADKEQLVAVSDCLAELPGPSPEIVKGEQLISDIQADAWWAAQEDAHVIDAFAAWSACMARSGYEYEHPMDANDDPQWATEKASAAEITVAKVDVACKEQTNLVAIWSSAEAEHQEALVDEHEAALRDYVMELKR